jgi:hypothetical protein
MEMSWYCQCTVRWLFDPFPPTIECILDHHNPPQVLARCGLLAVLSLQVGAPFVWPRFGWFDIAAAHVPEPDSVQAAKSLTALEKAAADATL